jgi:predicted RNA-binding protein associated with RNAse of E/G family
MINQNIVIENWIKPPKMVRYSNSVLDRFDNNELICRFNFPEKYRNNPFLINGKEILKKGEMMTGKRTFYSDRNYALLEYFSDDGRLTAYYIDITLPAILKRDSVTILDLKIDFWIYPDKINYIILDWNEFDDAVRDNLFSNEEITSCIITMDFIKKHLDNNNFDGIFTNYKRSSVNDWQRYKDKC